MASPVLDNLVKEVNDAAGVMESARVLIVGFKGKLDAAVAAALDGGATKAELAPLDALSTELDTKVKALADAVANNP